MTYIYFNNGFQYHIKMTPGTGKKGKTAKQAIQIFCAMKESIEKETQLMKVAKEEEITRNMVSTECRKSDA